MLRLRLSSTSLGVLASAGLAWTAAASGCSVDAVCLGPDCDDPSGQTSAATGTTSATGSSATGTTSGTGGSGGGLTAWAAPACSTVVGTSAVTFSIDGGVTTAPSAATPLSGIAYTFGIATLDVPGVVLADHAGELLLSRDAGCHFESLGKTGLMAATLAAAPAGLAYGWVDNADGLYRVEVGVAGVAPTWTPLTAPSAHIVGLGVDPNRPLELRVMNGAGQVFQSKDRGEHFEPVGSPCPATTGLIYRAAFDPHDLDHVVCAVAKEGAWITANGGADWIQAQGLGDKANGFSAVVSPSDGAVVWLEGLTLLPIEARHVFRSEDGGATFVPVVDEASGVVLTNGSPMWAHPTSSDRVVFEFGTDFQQYGTDVYVYDHALGSVKIHHHDYDQLAALAFSPFDPDILYLGVSSEQIQQ